MAGSGTLGAALLAAAAALPGCCGTGVPGDRGNRDSPEDAVEFLRRAFADDRPADQYDALHWIFAKRQGITEVKYRVARVLRPGLFRRVAGLLEGISFVAVEYGRVGEPDRPRDAAAVTVETPGGRGTFVFVDEPRWVLHTDDGPFPGRLPDLERVLRLEGEDLVAELRRTLDVPPRPGARIRRLEIHHDWLLYEIRSLVGFEDLIGEVRSMAEEDR